MAIRAENVEGLAELMKAFAKLPEDALEFVEKESYPPCEKIKHRARRYLEPHIKTGKLFSEGLKITKPNKRRKYKYVVFSKVYFTSKTAYGVPLELGHNIVKNGKVVGHVSAKPFLRPAADESKSDVINAMTQALNSALDKFGGR